MGYQQPHMARVCTLGGGVGDMPFKLDLYSSIKETERTNSLPLYECISIVHAQHVG